jgi:hypothetical protein
MHSTRSLIIVPGFTVFIVNNSAVCYLGFRRDVDEICALLGYYAASNGNPLPTFRDNVSVSSSRVKKPFSSWDFLDLEDGTDTLS